MENTFQRKKLLTASPRNVFANTERHMDQHIIGEDGEMAVSG
jgi:hypothetical protein